jgi:Carboxypeptidase regulatory-like domain/TonB-dependent Receptor Plug Domain
MKRVCLFLLVLFAAGIAALPAQAQVDTGSILGTVRDKSGGVVPGASVSLREAHTNALTVRIADAAGNYVATPLRIGVYAVSVELAGFKKQTHEGIVLRVQDRLRIDFELEPGDIAEAVVVTGEAPLVQSETSSLGEVVDARQIVGLPLNGRNYIDLATLTSGVIRTAEGSNGNVNATFVVNGTRGGQNNYLLDGIDNNSNDGGEAALYTNVDAIEEFKVQTSNYSAEFGRSGGAVVNASLKSGANEVRGSAFYFLRDESLDARGFFEDPDSQKAPFSFKQFGGTLGGPIRKDRTFFFVDYQGTRRNSADTGFYSVPTPAQRAGDFSGEGNSVIYDPLTGEPFPGNVIPADRFSPLATNFINLYPDPNQDGLKNNYLVNPISTTSVNQGDLRLDHEFSGADRVFLRLSLTKGRNFVEPPLPGLANGGEYGTGTSNSRTWGGALGFTHIFSSSTVNELRLGFNRVKGSDGITAGGQKAPPPELTVPGVPNDPAVAGVTVFDPAAYSHIGDPEFIPTYTRTQELQVSDTLSLVRGRHSVKTGFQFRLSDFDLFQIPQPRGKFSFSGEFTQDPDHNDGTGDALADALLGYASQIDISNITQTRNRTPVFGLFIQDDFKVNPSLTLNLGLRWDYTGPTVEADDRQSNFDYATGQVLVANQNGNSRGLIDVDKYDFAPRVGFAWTPSRNGKTALRGGYGIFYAPQEVRTGFQLGYSVPFFFALSQSSDFGVTPAAFVDEGFPSLDPAAAAFPSVLSADRRFRSPYYQQWNLGVQRDLGWNTLIEVAYVGSKGTRLQVLRDYNQPQPGPGDAQERRPYPQYGNFASITNAGSSTYNSIQLKLHKRVSNGLWLLSAFTYGKAYNDQPEICCNSPWPPDSYNIQAEHGPADYDQRYRSVTSFAWDLPFGKGRRLLDQDGLLNGILGGWQLGGIVTIAAGFPFSPATSLDTSNTGTFGQLRPDLVGNPDPGTRTPERWFNPEAYATPADFAFGNAPRNSLVGPGTRTADLYLRKEFQVGRRARLELRVEAFNAFNHPNFGLPDNYVDDGESAGTITYTALSQRQVQFGARVAF